VHLAALQLLHSTVACAQRHALGHVSTIAPVSAVNCSDCL